MTTQSEHYLIAKPCNLCHKTSFHLAFITGQTVTLTCTLCGHRVFSDDAKKNIDYYANTRKDIDIDEAKRLMEDTAQRRKSKEYKNLSLRRFVELSAGWKGRLEKQPYAAPAENIIPQETKDITILTKKLVYKNAFQEGVDTSEVRTYKQSLIRATLLGIITAVSFFNSWPLLLKIGVFMVLILIFGVIGSSKKFKGKV